MSPFSRSWGAKAPSHHGAHLVALEKRLDAQLRGRTIVGVYVSEDGHEARIGLVLDNGTQVSVERDPEGNGPGWLYVHERFNPGGAR